MAGTATVVTTPWTGNAWLDAITWGTEWSSGGTATVMSVYIAGLFGDETVADGSGGVVTGAEVWDEEVAAMNAAMSSFEAVCNIDFRSVASQGEADLVWASVDALDAGGSDVLGWANPPGEGLVDGVAQSLVAINWEAYDPASGTTMLKRGGYDFTTFIHELGHAVGLAHPHDDGGGSGLFPGVTSEEDLGDFGMNQGLYTMMSYNSGWATGPQGASPSLTWGFEGGPMALDIAALQVLYGANMSYRAGDTTYNLPGANQVGTFYSCIWDAGGTDQILGASARRNTIDLRAATLEVGPGGGGWVSHAAGIHGGFTIAKGAVIENARGGGLADTLTGNGVANTLGGLAGNDRLDGLNGKDVLIGGGGDDTLRGGSGDDRLNGQAGKDRLEGGGGLDDFVFSKRSDTAPGSDRDVIKGFAEGADDIVLSAIDANGSLSGNGAFRLDTGGSFGRGEIRQTVKNGNLLLEMNLDGDVQAEMSILLLGLASRLAATDFAL